MKKRILNATLGTVGCSAFAILLGLNVESLSAGAALLTVGGLCAVVLVCVKIAKRTAPELFDPSDRV